MAVRLVDQYLSNFVSSADVAALLPALEAAHTKLHTKTGEGSDFLGWLTLPRDYDKEEYTRIKVAAERVKKSCDVFVVIGIGGSYLGARAVIELLAANNYNLKKKDTPDVYFAGNGLKNISISATNSGESLIYLDNVASYNVAK